MMSASPLRHFPLYTTRDPQFAREFLSRFGVTDYEVTDAASTYQQRVNRVALRDLSITHSACSADLHLQFSTTDAILQRICVAGAGSATSGQHEIDLNARQWSAMTSAGETGSLTVRSDYAEFRVGVQNDVLKRKLGALLGDAPVDHFKLVANNDVKSPHLARFRRLLSFVLSEIDMAGPLPPGPMIDELGEALLISMLHGHVHNFTDRLMRPEPRSSSAQQRRIEEFIVSRCNETLTVEDIANAANISVRSVFRSFQEARGCSPLAYVKRLRLQRAQQMLRRDDPQITVTAVALQCGFHSLGHFARSYCTEFGELPSDTLLHARR